MISQQVGIESGQQPRIDYLAVNRTFLHLIPIPFAVIYSKETGRIECPVCMENILLDQLRVLWPCCHALCVSCCERTVSCHTYSTTIEATFTVWADPSLAHGYYHRETPGPFPRKSAPLLTWREGYTHLRSVWEDRYRKAYGVVQKEREMQKIRIRTGELEPSSYGFVDRFDEVAYLLAQNTQFRQRYYLLYPETWYYW